ncbi:ATP-binding cassette domain-containing protein [Terrisporobacter petrolearius]|uniref:ABC transporter ATP-binding protein n=1 Tax=Terrisporobacter petrolearius TaxID=1460447 RepID=UPI001D166E10|nr:ATP-binding cassette domain-containing protein [Terrisporobacter petrolearius]MCC3864260.1 ATP-binding cassette domain-containing protein [Terrisporobacter petrolearius]
MIKIKNIEKKIKYQKPLRINNLEIKKGYIYTIIGHNGSGKSTLLKILYNLTNYDNGEIDIESKGFSSEVCQSYISYNPQKVCFLRGTLQENFDYIYKYSQNKNLLDKNQLNKLISEFKLENKLKTDIKKLSGGEQAKAQFIRTLLLNKDYILLDEPMASLDFETRELVEKKIKLLKQENRAVVLVTHDFIQARKIGEKIIFMENLDLVGIYNSVEFFKRIL